MGDHGAGICAHVHAVGLSPGVDTGCLSNGRLGDKPDYPDDELLCPDRRVLTEVRRKKRHRHDHRNHDALLNIPSDLLDYHVVPVDGSGTAIGPRRALASVIFKETVRGTFICRYFRMFFSDYIIL